MDTQIDDYEAEPSSRSYVVTTHSTSAVSRVGVCEGVLNECTGDLSRIEMVSMWLLLGVWGDR